MVIAPADPAPQPGALPGLHGIALNLVTGFLGAGKTTLLRHLLAQHRAPGERVAVLVNEFGDVGIDGALLAGEGVQVKEVPGGCLCCANGVPFKIALNALLKQARPTRVLVEPSGLGHPQQLRAQLAAPEYRGVLEIRATLCVIDPVAARDPRVGGSELFAQQLASADVLVLNHADRAGVDDYAALDARLRQLGLDAVPRVVTQRGIIDPGQLDAPPQPRGGFLLLPLPADPGIVHDGARWPASVVFPHDALLSLLLALPTRRLKGVLHTDQGWLEINAMPALGEWRACEPGQDNRVEALFDADVDADIDAERPSLQAILDCLRTDG